MQSRRSVIVRNCPLVEASFKDSIGDSVKTTILFNEGNVTITSYFSTINGEEEHVLTDTCIRSVNLFFSADLSAPNPNLLIQIPESKSVFQFLMTPKVTKMTVSKYQEVLKIVISPVTE